MRSLVMLALCFLFATSAVATTLDFEGLPTTYYYFYGQTNIGGYYPGVNIGPTCYILDSVIGGYNSAGYPPHSGNAVAVSIGTAYIRVDFTAVTDAVSVWYTEGAGGGLFLEAYDSSDGLLDSDSGPTNYGTNNQLSVAAPGIAYVLIHNQGDFFTIDDLTYNEVPVPVEVSSWGAVKALYR